MIQKLFSKMLFSQIFSAFSVTICMFIDGVVIGRYLGAEAMAAFGLSISIVTLFSALGGTIAAGVQVIAGNAIGKGSQDEFNSAYSSSVVMSVIISAVCVLVIVIFRRNIAQMLGAPAGSVVEELTCNYLLGYIIGCPAFIGLQVLNPFLQLLNKRKIVLVSILCMAVTDILGDYLSVLVFKGGTFGMGLASSISYYAAFVLAVIFAIKLKHNLKFSFVFTKVSIMKSMLILGSTYTVYQLSRVVISVFLNKTVLSAGGDLLLASFTVAKNVFTLCISVGMGIAATTLLLTGVVWGERNRLSLEEIIRAFLKKSVVINGVMIIIVEVFAVSICRLFVKDNFAILDSAVSCMRIYMISALFFSVNASLRSFYQGIRKTVLAQVVCVLQICVLPVVFVLLSRALFPESVPGIWWALVVGEIATFVLVLLYSLMKSHKVAKLSKLLVLGAVEDNEIEPLVITLRTQDDVINASTLVGDTYKKLEPDGKKGFALSLCVEEIGMNFIQHGRKNSSCNMEVRFLKLPNMWRLEFRDDGTVFDPCTYYEMKNEADRFRCLGLKMVLNSASNIKYTNVVGLNSLIVDMEEIYDSTI